VPTPAEGDGDGAEALVTGFTAYDFDNLIAAKLAEALPNPNSTEVFETQFRGICTAVCRPDATRSQMDAGRRMLERACSLRARVLVRACAWCAPRY
jgi:hypothetical protein